MNIAHKFCLNYTVLPRTVTMIVIHVMDGSLAGTDAWFGQTASEVSAHYGIGLKGEVHQYVDEKMAAWHAGVALAPTVSLPPGNPNSYTIGIEHEGFVTKPGPAPWSNLQLQASAELIADICKRHGIPIDRQHIVGHHEIYAGHLCPGPQCPLDDLVHSALLISEGKNA